MSTNNGLSLVAPRVLPVLDPAFRPAVLADRAFRAQARATPGALTVRLGLEQADGSVSHFATPILPDTHPQAAGNFTYLERIAKFLLWSRGGFRIHFDGPAPLAAKLAAHYRETPTGKFDSNLVGERMFDHPIEVVYTNVLPPERRSAAPLGRHLDGCRIGFDLGGSDRKVAAVIEGKVVFSDEMVWDPYFQPDPQYHYDGIMDSLKKAAAHLPRVDAIGGSSAGVILNNRMMIASLFRGVPRPLFEARVKDIFLEIQQAWGVPFEVVNDGEVTALAGSLWLQDNCVLGIALGSSEAAGYINSAGSITGWLDELAFAPLDYNPDAPVDEWSGDRGCGVQYLTQQAVFRLAASSGIELAAALPPADKLKAVQALLEKDDAQARMIFETIGCYLGYAIAHYADFYEIRHLLILGRVTSGAGGAIILAKAREVLSQEFPALAARVKIHLPDESDRRVGQAIAAASLAKRI